MSRIRSTPHAHTTYVRGGKNTAEEMVLAAIGAGFRSVGLSEHGGQEIDPAYGLSAADAPAYIAEVRDLRKKYAGRIRVHLGVERDLFSTARREDYDYVIGSTHYLMDGETFYGVDWNLEDLLACREKVFGGDGAAMARAYFRQLADYAADFRPDILGHFDLIRLRNGGGALYDPEDRHVLAAQHEALEAVRQSGALLELNTGAMARGHLDTPYPEQRLLAYWKKLGGGVIVSSDAHSAANIDFAFERMPERLRAAGFETFWELGAEGEPLFVERALD